MERALEMLATQQVDPEVFRRVWARVMPDQRDSPILVVPPEGKGEKKLVKSSITRQNAVSEKNHQDQEEERKQLKTMLDQMWEGYSRLQILNQRSGRRSRYLQALAGDCRRAMRQLEASWFLMTGQREWQRPKLTIPEEPLEMGLRSQFLWEQNWRTICRQTGERTGDPVLSRLCSRLEEESVLHGQMIRQMLEQGRQGRY